MASAEARRRLEGIDREAAMKAYLAKGGGAPAAAPAAAAPSGAPTSDQVIFAITPPRGDAPRLVGQVQTVFQWKLTSPDSQWYIDLKNGKGSVTKGCTHRPT